MTLYSKQLNKLSDKSFLINFTLLLMKGEYIPMTYYNRFGKILKRKTKKKGKTK